MIATRRGFLAGIAATLAAPAIVRAESLMPVKVIRNDPILILPVRPTGKIMLSGYDAYGFPVTETLVMDGRSEYVTRKLFAEVTTWLVDGDTPVGGVTVRQQGLDHYDITGKCHRLSPPISFMKGQP